MRRTLYSPFMGTDLSHTSGNESGSLTRYIKSAVLLIYVSPCFRLYFAMTYTNWVPEVIVLRLLWNIKGTLQTSGGSVVTSVCFGPVRQPIKKQHNGLALSVGALWVVIIIYKLPVPVSFLLLFFSVWAKARWKGEKKNPNPTTKSRDMFWIRLVCFWTARMKMGAYSWSQEKLTVT